MKRFTLAGLAFLAGASMAAAQEIVIESQQEIVIREYVMTRQVEPIQVPADVSIEIGAILPEIVELYPIEVPDVEVPYRYVVVDDRTVLVEPETREIVHIIE